MAITPVTWSKLYPFEVARRQTLKDTLNTIVAEANADNAALSSSLTTGPAAGITGGTGTVAETSVSTQGGIITTRFLLDLTGLSSSTTDLDIIGQGVSPAYLGRILAAQSGTILTGKMTCLEAPVGGVTTIDVYAATEGTGAFDTGIGTLTETALLTASGAWVLGDVEVFSAVPAANAYIYLTGGAAGTAAAYTAGKFEIVLQGYA